MTFKEVFNLKSRLAIRHKLEEKYPIDKFAMVVIEGLHELDVNTKPYLTYKYKDLEWVLIIISHC